MGLISEIKQLIGMGYSLSQAVETVAPGGNVSYFEKAIKATPKRRKSRSRSRYTRKTFQASSVLYNIKATHKGMAETVNRVNQPDPQDNIIVTASGREFVMTDQELIPFDGMAPATDDEADDYGLQPPF